MLTLGFASGCHSQRVTAPLNVTAHGVAIGMTVDQARTAFQAQQNGTPPPAAKITDQRIEMNGFEAVFDNGRVQTIVSDRIERNGKALSTRSEPLISELGAPTRTAALNLTWECPDVVLRADLEDEPPKETGRAVNAFVLGVPRAR